MPEKYKGITVETGKEIVGYLLYCEGTVNTDGAYICPIVSEAGYHGLYRGCTALHFGPFVQVKKESVERVNG